MLKNLNPYERHKLIINEYVLNRPGKTKLLRRDSSNDVRDIDVIRKNHKFLWDDNDEEEISLTFEERLSKQYYDRLFKEYCICDLSRFKENKVALRWRTENEVVLGKGQFICGCKICQIKENLRTWEVNFGYMEQGMKKNALVKLRLCSLCSAKLNYHSQKREIKRMDKHSKQNDKIKKHKRKKNKKRLVDSSSGNESGSEVETSNKLSSEHNETGNNSHEFINVGNDVSDTHNVWKESNEKIDVPSRDEEFEKYLEDLIF